MQQTSELERACALLTPALLRAGDDLRETFLTGIAPGPEGGALELSPVAGPPLAQERAVVDLRLGDDDVYLAGRVLSHLDGRVRLRVTRGPLPRPPRSLRMLPAADTLVAVFVPEGAGMGRCHQPVLDLGARGLTLASSVPWASGTVLRDLSLVLRQQVIRRGEGNVLRHVPVLCADGCRLFRCGVRLRRATPRLLTDDPDVCEVRESERVRSLLWALSDLGAELQLEADGTYYCLRLTPVRGDRHRLPELEGRLDPLLPGAEAIMEAHATLFGSGYRILVRLRREQADRVRVCAAPVLREWHRRDEERCSLEPADQARLRFRHPVDGREVERTLRDLSPDGVGFALAAGDEDLLWPGLPLELAQVQWGELCLRPVEAVVKVVASDRCGVKIGGLPEHEADLLRVRLLPRSYSGLALHDGQDIDPIVAMHRKVGLYLPESEQNLDAAPEATATGWARAHAHPAGLMRTAVVTGPGGIIATANLMRAYEASWLIQHNATTSPTSPTSPGTLQSALLGLVLPRPDGEYFCAMVEVGGPVHTMWSSFCEATCTPEHRGTALLNIYAADARAAPPSRVVIRRLRGPDELLVERAARRLLNPLCVRSMSLVAGRVELPACRRDWARAGLERGREAFGAFVDGRCVAVLAREWASPGLSLSGFLSAGYLLPVLPRLDAGGEGLLALAALNRELPVPGDPPLRFLLAPPQVALAALAPLRYREVVSAAYLSAHRLGSRQYQRFIASRYGLVHARLRGRGKVRAA
jgi:hypothetical protein